MYLPRWEVTWHYVLVCLLGQSLYSWLPSPPILLSLSFGQVSRGHDVKTVAFAQAILAVRLEVGDGVWPRTPYAGEGESVCSSAFRTENYNNSAVGLRA